MTGKVGGPGAGEASSAEPTALATPGILNEDAAGAVHRDPLPPALPWSTRHLLFAALFFSFCLLLSGVALGCYLMMQRDFRWKTYRQLQGHLQENWLPRPVGSYLLMPAQGRPNWLRLSNDRVSVRFYDDNLQRKVQMGGPPEAPAEHPEQIRRVLEGRGRSYRYYSSNRFENWLMWATPVHDLSGRIVGVLETGLGMRPYDEMLRLLAGSLLLVAGLGMGISSLLAALVSNYLARPLESLASAMAKVTGGNFGARAPLRGSLEMQSVAEDFNKMVDELRQVFEAQKRFIADASHELKTPLTSITTMTELLQHSGPALKPERRERAWEVIGREVSRMDRLVQDLLTLSRFDEGGRDIVDLAAEMRHVLESYPRLTVRGPLAEGMVRTDSSGWTRSLRNLFDNAQAHTPENRQIWVSLRHRGHGYQLQVEDQGCGIPPEDLDKVTQRFFRSERSRSRHLGGTGLGLSMVDAWVRTCSGKLEVESQLEKGTCVKIWIPAR